GADLTIRDSFFHDNQVGILTAPHPESDVVVESTEFYRNRRLDDGVAVNSHNIYIGDIASFTLRYSYVHGAEVGHNVKTRARLNRILYSRSADGPDGRSSYLVDVADGGTAILLGNVLQQGRDTENFTMVSFAAESRR